MTFFGVRFYIDFEVSLVDKRFKGFRDCAIIIRRGSWKWAWHWVILCGSPRRLTFGCSLFILYCNVFRRLRLENYLKTTRWGKANHFRTVGLRIVSWILLWITGLKLESFTSLRHRFRLVESWPERTKLRTRANSLSFPPRLNFSVMFSSCLPCNRTAEVFSYLAIQTMFMFAEVLLADPFGWKCLFI